MFVFLETSEHRSKQSSGPREEESDTPSVGKKGTPGGKKGRKKEKEKDQQESKVLYDKVSVVS